MGRVVTVKKKCCNSSPRCATCPVVWHHLEDDGLAVRVSKRKWEPAGDGVPKKAMKAARRS